MTNQPSALSRIKSSLNGKTLAAYGTIIVVVHFLWNSMFIYPLKILTVFFHELSHALAAILTGGKVIEIGLVQEQGGHCVTSGGNGFLIASAGYLGSMLCGGVLLLAAAKSNRDKQIMAGLGVVLVAVSLIWVRPLLDFGFIFCMILGGAMVASSKFISGRANDWILRAVGLTSCLYATLDVKSDTIDRKLEHSDAGRLAEITGMPSFLWGYLWMTLAVIGTIGFIVMAANTKKKD